MPYGRTVEHEYCTAWRANGHLLPGGPSTGKMTEKEKDERRQVIQNNKLMEAANEVRRKWLADAMFAAVTPPKGAVRYIAETLTGSSYFLAHWIGGQRGLDALLDPAKKRRTDGYLPARANDARCLVVTLAAIGAAHEDRITRESWRTPAAEDARWLTFLTTNGYEPSDVEQIIIDAHAPKPVGKRPKLTVVPDEPSTTTPSPDTATGEGGTATSGPHEGPADRIGSHADPSDADNTPRSDGQPAATEPVADAEPVCPAEPADAAQPGSAAPSGTASDAHPAA